jgi:O-antigen ligase
LAEVAVISLPGAPLTRALVVSWALPASVMLAVAVSPFERAMPGSIFGFTLTTVELAIAIALAAGAAAWFRRPASFEWRTPITLPLVALVASAAVAAVLAPEFRGNAVRVTGRMAAAVALFVLVANVSRTDRVARQIAAALLAAAAVVGAIAVLELAQFPWVLSALKVFRPGFHVVGGQLRATSTLIYPTITSMFLEVAFALGLMWLASSRLAFAALVLSGAGVIATFTRSGLITITLSLAVYGGLLFMRRKQWGGEHTRLVVLAAALVALVLVSRSPQMLVARMSVEGSQDWYGATYEVPRRLTLAPGSFNDIDVTLTNQGRLTWQSTATPPFALSYHWLNADTEDVVLFDGLRTPFAHPVEPGGDVTMKARVRAPGYPGTYVLIWDVVQEHRTWLSLEGVFPGRSMASVEGAPVGAPLPPRGRMPTGVMRMPRSVLWETAFTIARAHPLSGIGPDNFRHTYGRYLGLAAWDERVHANNSYVEVLAGMGAIGVAALAWLILAATRAGWRVLRTACDARFPIVAASAAAGVAIATHALVDSFLTFTPTYTVFAVAAGLLFSPQASSAVVPASKGETC